MNVAKDTVGVTYLPKVKRGPTKFMTKDSQAWKDHPTNAPYIDYAGNERIKTGIFDIVGPEDEPPRELKRPVRK